MCYNVNQNAAIPRDLPPKEAAGMILGIGTDLCQIERMARAMRLMAHRSSPMPLTMLVTPVSIRRKCGVSFNIIAHPGGFGQISL